MPSKPSPQRLGIEGVVAENAGYEDITPILRDLAAGGAGLIICHASGYQTVCPEFAAESGVPVAVIENPGAVSPGLVSDIETQAQEVAYLAGVLAGKTTRDRHGRRGRLRRAADLELHDGRIRRGSQGDQPGRQDALQRDRRGRL